MAEVGSANIRITADDSGARKTLSGFFGFLKKSSSIAAGVMGGLAIFDTIKGSMQGAYDGTIGANASMEQYQATLTTVLKSSKKATQTLAWAQKFAAQTPFEIPDIVEATTRLSSYGLNAEKVLGSTGNMAAVMGKPLMQAVEAVADAQTGELERLKEFGITKKMLIDKAAQMGKKEVVNAKGQITDQKGFNDALFALMNDRFKGGMAIQSKTWDGMLSNVKDALGTAARTLSKPIFDKFKAGLSSVLPMTQALTQFAQGDIIGFITTVTQAFGQQKGLMITKFFLFIRDGVQNAKNVLISLKPSVQNVQTIFMNLLPILKFVGAGIVLAFTGIKNALPPIINGLTGVVAKITAWKGFIPVVAGVVAAFVAYRTTMAAIRTAQAAWNTIQAISIALSKAQRAAHLAMVISGGGVRGAMLAMSAAGRALNLTLLANPIVLIVALLVGLGVAFVVAYKKSETFRNVVNSAWAGIKTGFAAVINWFTTTLPAWVMGVLKWFDNLDKSARAKIQNLVMGVLTWVDNLDKSARAKIQNWVMGVLTWFNNLDISARAKIQNLKNGVISFFVGLVSGVILWCVNLYNSVISWFTKLGSIAKAIWNSLKIGIMAVVHALVSGAINIFLSLYNGVKNIINNLKNIVQGYMNIIKGIFTGNFGLIKAGVLQILTTLWNGIKNLLGRLGIDVNGLVGRIKNFFVNGWNSIKSNTVSIFSSIYTTITKKIGEIVTAARNLPGKIGDGLRKMAGKAVDGAISLGNSIMRGIGKGVNGVIGGVNWVLGKIGVKGKPIPTWNVPQYRRGTDGHPGGLAFLGDGNKKELYRLPNGEIGLSPNKATLMNLPAGTQVLPGNETERLLKLGVVPGYKNGIGDWIKKKAFDVWNFVSNPSDLFKKALDMFGVTTPSFPGILKDFGTGIFGKAKDGLQTFLKDKIKDFSFMGSGKVPGNVKSWIGAAVAATGVPGNWFSPLITMAMKESGGKTGSSTINRWDINAKRGTPSMGLMQTIMPTFRAYAKKGMNDIMNPIHNAVAAIRYIQARYGSVFNTPGIKSMMHGGPYKGYAKGGFFLNGATLGLFGEGGPEMALPLIGKNMMPYAQAVAGNLSRLFNGSFGSQQEIHNHYWNVNADEINEVQKLVTMVGGLRKQTRKGG